MTLTTTLTLNIQNLLVLVLNKEKSHHLRSSEFFIKKLKSIFDPTIKTIISKDFNMKNR